MKEIQDIFTCKMCNNVFIKPVLLPCLNTICEEHTAELANNSCTYCGEFHVVPSSGFKRNEMARLFIKSNFYLNEKDKEIKIELDNESNELNFLFEEFSHKDDESEKILAENFAHIREKINSQRDNLKMQIDFIADKMIVKTNRNEIECKERLLNLKKNWSSNSRTDLNMLKEELDDGFIRSKVEKEKIEIYKLETQKIISDLRAKINKIEHVRRKIDSCFFETSNSYLENNVFGKLLVEINDYKVISCSGDRCIKTWDANSGKKMNKYPQHF